MTKLLFMLVTVAALGTMVSCKDTNEDFITKNITQIIEQTVIKTDAEAIAALQAQIDNANKQLAEYKELLDLYRSECQANSCKCSGDGQCSCNPGEKCQCDLTGINSQIEGLQSNIEALTGTIQALETRMEELDEKADATELANLKQTVEGLNNMLSSYQDQLTTLTNNYNTLAGNAATDHAIIEQLQNAVKTLEEALKEVKSCHCDGSGNCQCDGSGNCSCSGSGCTCQEVDLSGILERLSTLEQSMIEAKSLAQQAAKDAKDALTKANTAIETANGADTKATLAAAAAATAQSTANAAQGAANAAKSAADAAQRAADAAQGDATAAKELANKVKELAEKAQEAAEKAQETADKALGMASQNAEDIKDLLKRVGLNEDAIKDLIETVDAHGQSILDHAGRIESLETQVTTLSDNVANALKDAADAKAAAEANEKRIEALETLTKDMPKDIADLKEALGELQGSVNDLKEQVGKNTKAIEEMGKTIGDMQSQAEKFDERITALEKDVDKLKEDLAAVKATAEAAFGLAKAYADDEIGKVKEQLATEVATLTGKIDELYKLLYGEEGGEKGDITTINEEITDIYKKLAELSENGCTCDLSGIQTQIDDLVTLCAQFATINGKIETLEGQVTVLGGKVTDIENGIVTIEGRLDSAEGEITTIKTDIDGLDSRVTSLETNLGTLSNTIQTLDDVLNGRIDELKEDLEAFKTKTGEDLDGLKNDITQLREDAAKDLQDAKDELQGAIDEVENALNDYKGEVSDLIEELSTKIDTNADGIAENADAIKTLSDKVADILENIVPGINNNIDEVKADLQNKFTALDDALSALKDVVEANSGKIDENAQAIADIIADAVLLEARVTAIENTYVKTETFEATVEELTGLINGNTAKIESMEQEYKAADAALAADIAALQSDLSDLKERVATNEENIAKLTKDVAKLQEILAKQVTGLILEGTDNPVFGSVTTPFGTQSNVLVGLYGELKHDVDFPTARTQHNVKASASLTEKDMQMIGGSSIQQHFASGSYLVENEDGTANAGTLYVTVNPAQVDHTGLNLSIVNTQDKDAHVSLGALEPSEAVLRFGFTRGGKNGFYEAPAYIKTEELGKVQRINFNQGKVKDTFKEIVNKRQNMDLSKVANNVYDILKGFQIDRNAVKCEWTTGEDSVHSVTSGYDLAATAVQPLGLNFGEDFDFKNIPGFKRVYALLDEVSKTVNDAVHTVFKGLNNSALVDKLKNLEIKDIKIADLTADQLALFKVSIDTTIFFDGLSYHLDLSQTVDVPVKFDKDLTIPVNFSTTVTVPVEIEDDYAVDLSNVNVTVPTIVVTGSATGHATTSDLVSELLVPVKDEEGNIVGYTSIPLDQIPVSATINGTASLEDGKTITLDGEPIAHVKISKDIDVDVDITDEVTYTLQIDETVTTTVNIQKWVYFGDYQLRKDADGNAILDANGKPIYDYVGDGNGDAKSIHIWVTRDMSDAAESLWGTAQDALGGVNGMLADLRDLVDELNKVLADVNSYEKEITNKTDSFMDKIKSYLEKINNKVVSFINNTNSYVQPMMVVSTDNGTKRLSGAKNYPTLVDGNYVLFTPTTQSMEIVVPVCKKHVAVTNVFKGDASAQGGDADCLEKLQSVNNSGQMNKIIPGSQRAVDAYRMKSGYTYEVSYSCLDFLGNISVRKYYVKAK